MQYIKGQTLQQAWPVLTPSQRTQVLAQQSDYIAEMHALHGIHLAALMARAL